MPFSGETIIVEGLKEFRKEVKDFDDQKLLGAAHKLVAAFVGDEADKNRAKLIGRFPSLEQLVMRPSAATTQVAITLKKPFGHAAEWGAKTHVVFGRRYPQRVLKRPVWPDWGTDGHLVHPVLREKNQEIIELYARSIEEATRQIFPD